MRGLPKLSVARGKSAVDERIASKTGSEKVNAKVARFPAQVSNLEGLLKEEKVTEVDNGGNLRMVKKSFRR